MTTKGRSFKTETTTISSNGAAYETINAIEDPFANIHHTHRNVNHENLNYYFIHAHIVTFQFKESRERPRITKFQSIQFCGGVTLRVELLCRHPVAVRIFSNSISPIKRHQALRCFDS